MVQDELLQVVTRDTEAAAKPRSASLRQGEGGMDPETHRSAQLVSVGPWLASWLSGSGKQRLALEPDGSEVPASPLWKGCLSRDQESLGGGSYSPGSVIDLLCGLWPQVCTVRAGSLGAGSRNLIGVSAVRTCIPGGCRGRVPWAWGLATSQKQKEKSPWVRSRAVCPLAGAHPPAPGSISDCPGGHTRACARLERRW